MTIEQIAESEKPMLSPGDVAEVLHCHPYAINVQVRQDASKLGFPVTKIGSRVKIPREAFLKWFNGEK